MSKVDPVIIRETKNVALTVLILSALLEAVFLVIGLWNLPVLFGNLLGAATGILNFFLMGIGLQKALNKDAKDARVTANFSHTMRNLMIVIVIVLSIFLDCFNIVSTIVSIFFASVGIYLRAFLVKKTENTEETEEISE